MTEPAVPGTAEDLEYDLAHDGFRTPQRAAVRRPHIQVATTTADEGGDYSYDLAHDIPPQR